MVAMTQIASLQALPLVDGRPPDVAQIPQELQPNLITAAVAMGLQHAPVIKSGSDRLAYRWGWSISVCPMWGRSALRAWLTASHFPSSTAVHAKLHLLRRPAALLCPAMDSQSMLLPATHRWHPINVFS